VVFCLSANWQAGEQIHQIHTLSSYKGTGSLALPIMRIKPMIAKFKQHFRPNIPLCKTTAVSK
jgi:hypothetical protein